MADNLASNREFRDLKDRVRRLEAGTPLYAASVTEGRVRFIGGLLRIDTGGRLEIEGTLQVDGTTEVTGTFDVTGPWTLSGNGDITGELTVTGPWTIEGNGDITGNVDVTGDIEVLSGGQIKAGAIVINPTDEGGSVSFGGGKSIHAGSGHLGIYNGDSFVAFNAGGVGISGPSGPVVTIGTAGFQVAALPTISQASVPGSFPDAIVYWSGAFRRVVP